MASSESALVRLALRLIVEEAFDGEVSAHPAASAMNAARATAHDACSVLKFVDLLLALAPQRFDADHGNGRKRPKAEIQIETPPGLELG